MGNTGMILLAFSGRTSADLNLFASFAESLRLYEQDKKPVTRPTSYVTKLIYRSIDHE